MKDSSKTLSFLFLVAGIGLIIVIFLLFLQNFQEEKLFYLNMLATSLVFVIAYVRPIDIFGTVENVAKNGPEYGLKWYGVWLYTPLALGLIICSILYRWRFDYCFIAHILLLFILLIFFFLGFIAKKNVNRVMENIETRKAGLKEINSKIDLLEIQCKMGPGNEYLESINNLRENIRYITASDNQTKISLEEKLISKIQLISSQIEYSSQSSDVINEEIKACQALVELRKNNTNI